MKAILKSLVVVILAGFGGVSAAVGLKHVSEKGSGGDAGPVEIHVSSAFGGYSSIEALGRDADAVVVAHIREEQVRVVNEHIWLTDSRMAVTRVIKGELVNGDVVTVRQTGGIGWNGEMRTVKGDPLMRKDTAYLLFLKRVEGQGLYYAWAGAEGRLVVDGNSVVTLSAYHHDPTIRDLGISPLPVDQVAERVMKPVVTP